MVHDILVPFLTIGLAELGDKTQLTVFCLASKTRKYFRLLLGVVLAFIIADGLAVFLGSFITRLIPISYIKLLSGIVFISFGVFMLIKGREEEVKCEIKTPFASGFGLILLSEMGDKTQIVSGLFATQFNPLLVLVGVVFALAILSIMAVYLGKFVTTKINKNTISVIAGILFIIIGTAFLFQ